MTITQLKAQNAILLQALTPAQKNYLCSHLKSCNAHHLMIVTAVPVDMDIVLQKRNVIMFRVRATELLGL